MLFLLFSLFLFWFIWAVIMSVEFLWYYYKNGKSNPPIGKRFSDKLWNCIFCDYDSYYNGQFVFVDNDGEVNFY